MKTAASIPNDVSEKAKVLARHTPDEVTESINQVYDHLTEQDDGFTPAAARRVLEKTEW